MKFAVRFRKEVPDDIAEACRWYEERKCRLGQQFIAKVKETLARVAQSPTAYASGARGVRSARLRRFPYIVHYRFTGQEVVVLAVMYGGRDSSAWEARV